MCIKLSVEGMADLVVILGPPSVQGRFFVIDEKPTVLDGRLSLDRPLRRRTNEVMLLGWDIGPKVIPVFTVSTACSEQGYWINLFTYGD
jgi:hypothetical protein